MSRPLAASLVEFLPSLPLFAGLPARETQALAAGAVEVRCAARAYVFMEGEVAAWLCVVRTGHVRIVRHSSAGKDVVLELLGPGEVFGGVAVFERRPYPASAQAIEASVIVKLPADLVTPLADRYPSIIREMARTMGRRLRAAHDAVQALAVEPVESRLATALLRVAGREGVEGRRGLELPFHLTRQSLADMSGTTVESAIRVVTRWLRERLLEQAGDRLILRDVASLRKRAEGRRG